MLSKSASLSVLLMAIGGCVGLPDCGPFSQTGAHTETDSEFTTVNRTDYGAQVIDHHATRLQLNQLTPGQQVQIVASVEEREHVIKGGNREVNQYFGTIASVDSEHVVLKDVSIFVEAEIIREIPLLGRIPFIRGKFKNTALAREFRPVPGEISVPRSGILFAELCSEDLQEIMPVFERIGVDFK